MASEGGFSGKVSELERALGAVESNLSGQELAHTQALAAAILEVHRAALFDLCEVVGDDALRRAAALYPSLAWLLACHEIDTTSLHRAITAALAEQQREAHPTETPADFVPLTRLVRHLESTRPAARAAEPTP